MKVFHQDRARRKGIAVGVLAASMLASVLSLAPAAHAQPNWVEVESCDVDDLIEAVEIANAEDDIDTIVIDEKKCDYEFETPYRDGVFTANALPLITDDLTIYGNRAQMENDGDFFMRFLEAAPDVDVELRDMTIEDFVLRVPGASGDPVIAGGAILMDGGDLTLRNVTLEDNEVIVLDADGADVIGGGAIASLGGSVTLRSSTVKGNEVSLVNLLDPGLTIAAAGGVGVDGDADSVLTIEASTVKGNKVSATGIGGSALAGAGGVAAIDGARLVMTGSSVTSNTASARASNGAANLAVAEAGGVFADDTEDDDGHVITNSKIDGNKASAEGGALAIAVGGGLINLDEDGPSDDADAADGLVMNGGSISSNKATCDDVCVALG
ncbi:MAG TPA: hypothetical protein VEG38_13275, partial [Acidimicrobiia bacterium]|nr:hypothetical protein [Acidimicrobiia bacterium]